MKKFILIILYLVICNFMYSKPITIGFVGDSYCVGMTMAINKFNLSNNSFILKSIYSKGVNNKIPVKYYCIAGATINGGYNGINTAIIDKCDIIVIHLGINDCVAKSSLSQIKSNMIDLINYIKLKGVIPYICIPNCPHKNSTKVGKIIYNNYLNLYKGIIEATKETNCKYINLYNHYQLQQNVETITLYSKNIHPNLLCYKMMVLECLKIIKLNK